jgi:hypothetical protein
MDPGRVDNSFSTNEFHRATVKKDTYIFKYGNRVRHQYT